MSILDVLKQYANSTATPNPDVNDHFDQAANAVPQAHLGSSIAAALRSDATPAFGQSVGTMFGQSNPQQQAGVVNQIIQSLGTGALSGVAGGILGRLMGGSSPGGMPTVTPAQASQLSPADVSVLADHAQKQNPSVIDEVGSFYAQHPTLVKTLGAVALSAVMGHLSRR